MVENSHDKHIEEETEPSGRLGRLGWFLQLCFCGMLHRDNRSRPDIL